MSKLIIYPWQLSSWNILWKSHQNNRLSHALGFTGPQGVGKKHFATQLAAALLCQQPSSTGERCEVCHACHLVDAGSHPDLLVIEPLEDKRIISIDQIRDVIQLVNETTLQSGLRVVIIHPANALNTNAANALLKTLEEPSTKNIIILIDDQSRRLPATIVSRCHKIVFSKPSAMQAEQWLKNQNTEAQDIPLLLKIAEGAPLKAMTILNNDYLSLRTKFYNDLCGISEKPETFLQVANEWQETDLLMLVDLFMNWLLDGLRYKLTQTTKWLKNNDYAVQIQKINDKFSQQNLLSLLDYLKERRKNLLAALNLNKQLFVEDLLIRWMTYVSG